MTTTLYPSELETIELETIGLETIVEESKGVEISPTELRKRIADIASEALNLKSGFKLMSEYTNSELSVADVSDKFQQLLDKYEALKKWDKKLGITPELIASASPKQYDNYLALGTMDHDFGHPAAIINNIPLFMGLDVEEKAENILQNNTDKFFCSYENLRLGLGVIGYLATGDKQFISYIPRNSITKMIESTQPSMDGTVNDQNLNAPDSPETVASTEYFTFLQLVRNAFKFARIDGYNTQTDISLISLDHTSQFKVTDRGSGIHPDILPTIFGKYTNGEGTGLGLQFVNRILDLHSGYATVTTTQPQGNTFSYDTLDKQLKVIDTQPQGTTFELNFPPRHQN